MSDIEQGYRAKITLAHRAAEKASEMGARLDMEQMQVRDYGHRLDIAISPELATSYHAGYMEGERYVKNPHSIEDFIDALIGKYPERFTQKWTQ